MSIHGKTKRQARSAIAAIAVAGGVALTASPPANAAVAKHPVTRGAHVATIRVAYALSTQANFYAAEKYGYFTKQHIRIAGTSFANGTDLLTALVSGSVDVGFLGVPPLITADSKGSSLQAFSLGMNVGPMDSLYVRPGSGIQSAADLKGKTVGTTEGSQSDVLLHYALKKAGVSAGSVNIEYLTPPALVAAYSQGQLNAVWTFSTPGAQLLSDGAKIVQTSTDIGLADPAIWVASKKYISVHTRALRAFQRALDEGAAVTNGHPQTWDTVIENGAGLSAPQAAIAQKYLGNSAVTSAQMTSRKYPLSFGYRGGFTRILSIENTVMKGMGLITTKVVPSDLVTNAIVLHNK